VSDFADSEILYSFKTDFSPTQPGFSAQTLLPELRMGDENGNFFSPLYAIYENDNGGVLNYNLACWHKLKTCRAKVGMLAQAENRQHLFGLSSERSDVNNDANRGIRLQIREQGGDNNDWVDCVVVGRTLDIAEDPSRTSNKRYLYEIENDDLEISYGVENSFDEAQLGLSGYQPSEIRIYTDTDGLQGIEVATGNGNNDVIQAFGIVNGNPNFEWEITSPIAKITLRYAGTVNSGTVDGYVCGIVVEYQTGNPDQAGCSTSNEIAYEIDVTNGEGFAGFIGFSEINNDEFLITPLVYKTVDSMVYYYGRTHNSVTMHVNLFTSGSYTYKYTSWDEIDTTNRGVGAYGSTEEAEVTFSTGGENTVEIPVSCGCIRVAFEMPDDSTFYAWSFGFMEKTEIATSGTSSGNKYMTASHYEVNSNIDNCPDMRLMKYYTTAIGGVLYLDGFLGVAISSSITNVVDEADFLDIPGVYNQVQVYYSGNDVAGLRLSWSGSSVASIGATSGNVDQTLTPNGANEILTALEITENQNFGGNQIVKAFFSEPTPPCLFSGQTVLDIDGSNSQYGAWIQATDGGLSADRLGSEHDEEADADQYQYWFHMPVSYDSIHVELSGYFLSQECDDCKPEKYSLTLDSSGSDGKGHIATGKFYHLNSEHQYFFRAKGEVNDYVSTTGADLESEYNTLDDTNFPALVAARTFTTPDGVRYFCEDGGDTFVQVEYEALPDIEIKLAEANWTDLNTISAGSGNNFASVSTIASTSQQDQFPNTEFFHFPVFGADNKHCYPKFPEFTGYPVKVLAYWSSSVNAQCIQGLGLAYKNRNGAATSTYWLAGDQTGYDNALSSDKEEIDLEDKIIDQIMGSTGTFSMVVDGTTTNFACLRTIEFEYVGSSADSGCIGPLAGTSADCFQNAFTPDGFSREKTNFYFYAFSGSIATTGGDDYIVALSAHYAYVDLPDVTSGTNCQLADDIDWNYIRNTVWYKHVDLNSVDSNDQGNCGVTQYVYAFGDPEVTAQPDQWDPDRDTPATDGDHEVVYHQALTRSRDHPESALVASDTIGGLDVTRNNGWEINLFCYYNATKNVHSEFKVTAEPEWHADGTNEFKFSLRMYKECNYANEYDDGATPIMLVNEPVYMAVTLDNTGLVGDTLEDYQVVGFACWASKGPENAAANPGDYYLLAGSDGCYADSTFRWNDSATTSKKEAMYFDAFAFFDETNSATEYTPVFITCRVRACLSDELAANGDCHRDDKNNACDPATRSTYDPFFPASRARRNAKGQEIEKIQTISSRTAFIVKKRDVENAVHIERGNSVHTLDQGGVRMAAGMFSLFVTTMFFCLMVISYKVYRLRNNYKKLKEEAQ